MVDASSQVESMPTAKSLLKTPIGGLDEPSLKFLLSATNPDVVVRFVADNSQGPKREKDQNGNTVLIIPESLAVVDYIRMAGLLAPELKKKDDANRKSSLGMLVANLKNGAILLSHMTKGIHESEDIIEYLYNLGGQLDATMRGVRFSPQTANKVQHMNIAYPSSVMTREQIARYDRELKFYLLFGKNIALLPDESFPEYKVAGHTVYSLLYKKWRDRQQLSLNINSANVMEKIAYMHTLVDSEENRERFENEYLSKIVDFLEKHPQLSIDFIRKSLQGQRGSLALQNLVQMGALQQFFGEAMVSIGERHMAEKLFIRKDLRKTIEEVYGREYAENFMALLCLEEGKTEKLFVDAAEAMASGIKDLPIERQLNYFFELVRAFPTSDYEAGSFSSAIETREMNCTIKSFLLGNLLEKYLGDRIYILGVSRVDHVELIIVEKIPNDPTSPLIIGINANSVYLENFTEDGEPEESTAAQTIFPTNLPEGLGIPETPPKSRAFFGIEIITDPLILNAVRSAEETYGSPFPQFFPISNNEDRNTLVIGPWRKLVKAGIINNLGETVPETRVNQIINHIVSLVYPGAPNISYLSMNLFARGEKDLSRKYAERGVELFPDAPYLWVRLGLTHQNNPVAMAECFRKAVELDTSDNNLWFLLGDALMLSEDIDSARRCYRRSVLLSTNSSRNWLGIAKSYEVENGLPPLTVEEFQERIFALEKVLELYRSNLSVKSTDIQEIEQLLSEARDEYEIYETYQSSTASQE